MKKLLLASLFLAVATGAFAASIDYRDPGEPVTPGHFGDQAQPGRILLIEDQWGWGYNAHDQILAGSGIPWDLINSSQIAAWDFSQYDKIITTGQQPDQYYYNIQSSNAKFEDFMNSGGCVSFEIANYFGGANEVITWPAGFRAVIVDCINQVSIDDPNSCLVQNVSLGCLQNWNCSQHGTIGNTPAGYSSVVSSYAGTAAGAFPYGNGAGFISHQPLEWGYNICPQYVANFDLCECGQGPTATQPSSWGAVKALYR